MEERPTGSLLSREDILAIERGLEKADAVEVKRVGGEIVVVEIRRQKVIYKIKRNGGRINNGSNNSK